MASNSPPRAAGSKNGLKSTQVKSASSNGPTKGKGRVVLPPKAPDAPLDQSEVSNIASQAPQTAQDYQPSPNGLSTTSSTNPASTVNRKKQKRREKQAARLAAEQQTTPETRAPQPAVDAPYNDFDYRSAQPPPPTTNGFDYAASDYDEADRYEPAEGEDLYYTDDDGHLYERTFGLTPNGFLGHSPIPQPSSSRKEKKKPEGKENSFAHGAYGPPYPPSHPSHPSHFRPPPPPPPPPPMSNSRAARHVTKDRIWNTSTQEERERIKEFWLSLGEEERRSLVKVEKEAVLKKMKEQQKHSCSCTVCGRKRTAIEEELEQLYDAYYEELEQYANHQQISLIDGTPIMPPTGLHHPMSRFHPPRNPPPPLNYQRASRGRIQEIPDNDETMDEEEFSEDDEDEEYSDEEADGEPVAPATDFFNFGNSLTVQGGILTVADDLLKNDGKKFIEMMEQLAERRMQREEDAQYAATAGLSHPAMQSHNHGPAEDDVVYDDEEDEDSYESGDDEEYEDDEMETMTEEQRMEEGRRMFQIFAARMFEQRVLTAYREKVAAERQQKLIEELEEESRLDTQREAKKAKEAQKKKDKKRQLKLKQEEDKAQREAKKAAEEAAARAEEEKKLEEQRQKKEEQRKKKEAEKKAQEEERQRKEADKQRRLQEAKEQQAEQERKQREHKERERKRKEEAKKKEREEKEVKEKAAAEKRDREVAEKREKDAQIQAEKESKAQARKEEQAGKLSSGIPPVENPNSKSSRPPAQTRSSHASPHLQIATPVVPKAPTPIRIRQPSFQDSRLSSPRTSQAPSTVSTTSPALSNVPPNNAGSKATPALPQHPRRTPPFHPTGSTFITQPPGLPAMGGIAYPHSAGPMMAGATSRAPMQDPFFGNQPPIGSPQQRHFAPHGGLPFPSGMNVARQAPPGRGAPIDVAMTEPGQTASNQGNSSAQYVISRDTMPSHSRSHSRQTSASLERSALDMSSFPATTQPIARPAPIRRPSSVAPHQLNDRERNRKSDVDDLTNHLGSSALLDDTDVPLTLAGINHPRRGSVAPGGPFRQGFGTSPMFPDPIGANKIDNLPRGSHGGNGSTITWGAPHMPFGAPPMAGSPQWSNTPGMQHWYLQPPSHRSGFHPADSVLRQVELMKPANESTIPLQEMLDICDTEGNQQNGGGFFIIESAENTSPFIKFDSGRNSSMSTRGGVPGDIGSPIPGSGFAGFGGMRPYQLAGGLHNPPGF
ncbi:MAG: hypothetical protein LQ344_002242 [Seirophora lacunosa]|nr:MAG: hypothetical protein LQ344_002242 [Seirophora lacunosa]